MYKLPFNIVCILHVFFRIIYIFQHFVKLIQLVLSDKREKVNMHLKLS